jgi:class 3 adenylate cyclase
MFSSCPNCGRPLTSAAAFCPHCGVKAEGPGESAAVAAELGGLDSLGPALPPDALGEITEKFLTAAEGVAVDYGGTVTREDATTITIAFPEGTPSPADRAAECALALRDVTRDLLVALLREGPADLHLTTGVDSRPEVSAGEAGVSPRAGAKRLRTKATAWVILASEAVRTSTSDEFEYATVGFYQTRTGTPPVKIYQLLGKARTEEAPPPPEREPYASLPEQESAFTRFLADTRAEGRRRVLLVTGEEGMGKTTSLEQAARLASAEGFRVFAATCYSRRRFCPLGAWVPIWTKMFAEDTDGDPSPENAAAALAAFEPHSEIWGPVFAGLAGPPPSAHPYVADAAPAFRRRRIFEIATRFLLGRASEAPTALLFDDFDRADSTSRALLAHLLAAGPEVPLAVILAVASPDDSLRRLADEVVATPPLPSPATAAFQIADENTAAAGVRFALSQGRPDLLKALWLWALLLPDAKIGGRPHETLTDLSALYGRLLRDLEPRGRRATATVAALGLPLLPDELLHVAAESLGDRQADREAWQAKLEELRLLRTPLGETAEARGVPPHLVAALLSVTAMSEEERAAASGGAAAFLAARRPAELSARLTLEIEAGHYVVAFELAHENARRARWFGAPHDAVAQLTAIIQELERGPAGRVARGRLPELLFARAEAFQEAGLVAAALNDLEHIAHLEEELTARQLYTQGQVYQYRNYSDEAENAYLAAIQAAARAGDKPLLAEVEVALARLLLHRGEIDKAAYELEKSLKARRPEAAGAYGLLADLNYRRGRITAAAKAAHRCLARVDRETAPVTAATAGLACAPIIFESGAVAHARKLLHDAFQTFDVLGDPARQCEAKLLETEIGLLTESLETTDNNVEDLLRRAEPEKSGEYVASASVAGAVAAVFRGERTQYRYYLNKARETAAGATEPTASKARFAEAIEAYYVARDYAGALALAEEAAAELETERGLYFGEAIALAAAAAIARDDCETGRALLNRADLTRRAQESKLFAAEYHYVTGVWFARTGDHERSLQYSRAAAAAAREMGLWRITGESYLSLAALASGREREEYSRRAQWTFEHQGATFLAERARESATAFPPAG